jgi:hypothetical protein
MREEPSVGVRASARVRPCLGSLLCYHSNMAKSTYDNIAKPVRKRSASTGTLVGVRMQDNELNAIDAWAKKQTPPITRPHAIRRLVEIALAGARTRSPRYLEKTAAKARELAARAIDGLIDPAAPADEKAIRKRRLLKGPSVFRDVRVDQKK